MAQKHLWNLRHLYKRHQLQHKSTKKWILKCSLSNSFQSLFNWRICVIQWMNSYNFCSLKKRHVFLCACGWTVWRKEKRERAYEQKIWGRQRETVPSSKCFNTFLHLHMASRLLLLFYGFKFLHFLLTARVPVLSSGYKLLHLTHQLTLIILYPRALSYSQKTAVNAKQFLVIVTHTYNCVVWTERQQHCAVKYFSTYQWVELHCGLALEKQNTKAGTWIIIGLKIKQNYKKT